MHNLVCIFISFLSSKLGWNISGWKTLSAQQVVGPSSPGNIREENFKQINL